MSLRESRALSRETKQSLKIMKKNNVYSLYLKLMKKYGRVGKWWPEWCCLKKSLNLRQEIALGAILTQQTNWHNVEKALNNLKKAKLLSIEKIGRLKNLAKLENLIKPSGFYRIKAKRLYTFCSFIVKQYGSFKKLMKQDLIILRPQLLTIYGIGPETADSILLYALDKPTFVIDEYTKRLVKQKKLAKKLSYDYLKKLFEKNLPVNVKLYQDFHALIVVDQKKK